MILAKQAREPGPRSRKHIRRSLVARRQQIVLSVEVSLTGSVVGRSLPQKCGSQEFAAPDPAGRRGAAADQLAAAARIAKLREPPASANGSNSSPVLTKPRLGRKLPLGKIASAP